MTGLRSNLYLAMLFRLGAVLLIGWLIQQNTRRNAEDGQRPIRLSEVEKFLPAAHRLKLNPEPNGGFRVVDRNKQLIGFVTRTMPWSRKI